MRRISYFITDWATIAFVAIFAIATPILLLADVQQSSSSTQVVCPTTLKAVLVQFNDVKGDRFFDGSQWQNYTSRYTMQDFENLLESLGTYTGTRGTDNEPVFGSFRDYFWENSRQDYSPTVTILNDTDAQGFPVWITLPQNKSFYSSSSFLSAANSEAEDAGLNISDVSAGGAVRLCYIYAGNFVSAIDVFATSLHGSRMVVPERFDKAFSGEDVSIEMTHMGYYSHEFGHLMGAHHTTSSKHHSLMDTGHKAGTRLANRPTSMNPWFLFKSGWASLTYINADLDDVSLAYNTSPTTFSSYYIRKIPGTSECFLIENRRYDNTYDKSLPGAKLGMSAGILIWNIINDGLNLGETDLVEADGVVDGHDLDMALDMFRPGVYTDGKINDVSTPANLNRRNGTFSRFAISEFTTTTNPLTVDITVNFVAPPTELSIVNAGSNGQHPVLQWSASVDPSLDHYAIYRGGQDFPGGSIYWYPNPEATTTSTTWTDTEITINTTGSATAYYRVTALDNSAHESDYSNTVNTKTTIIPKGGSDDPPQPTNTLPQELTLYPNYPNPCNPGTEIRFALPADARITVKIYNLRGEEVRSLAEQTLFAGEHTVQWDGRDNLGDEVASGVYLYRFQALPFGEKGIPFTQTRKLTLVR